MFVQNWEDFRANADELRGMVNGPVSLKQVLNKFLKIMDIHHEAIWLASV